MVKALPLPDEPKKAAPTWRNGEKAKGYTQPLPFAEGQSITFGEPTRWPGVNVKLDTADLMFRWDETARRTAGSCCVR